MQTFISDIIPKIQKFSQRLDDITLLTNQHWVVIDEIDVAKNVYIFRKNYELLVSSNGNVEKGNWEYLGNNSLLIDKGGKSYLFKHGFFDENILALKIDGKNEYVFLINENRYDGELNSFPKVIDFLNKKYIELDVQKIIDVKYEINQPKIEVKSEEQLIKEREKDRKNRFEAMILIVIIIVFFIVAFLMAIPK